MVLEGLFAFAGTPVGGSVDLYGRFVAGNQTGSMGWEMLSLLGHVPDGDTQATSTAAKIVPGFLWQFGVLCLGLIFALQAEGELHTVMVFEQTVFENLAFIFASCVVGNLFDGFGLFGDGIDWLGQF